MVGEIVRKYRTQRDLSLRSLSKITGLSYSFIGDIERGRTEPSVKTLLTLVDALDIPLDEIKAAAQERTARESA